jgi:hypothetical protein
VPVFSVEDGADVGGNGAFYLLPWYILASVLLEMKLAALPKNAAKDGLPCCLEAKVGSGEMSCTPLRPRSASECRNARQCAS